MAAGCSPAPPDSATGTAGSGEPLRVIVRPDPVAFLPRNGEPVMLDREIAQGLSRYLGRPYKPVVVADYSQMIDALLAGKGDVIAAEMSVTDARSQRVAFSLPYEHVDEMLIVPAGKQAASDWQDLSGKTVCVRPSSAYAETLRDLQQDGVDVHIAAQPDTLNTEDIVDLVDGGQCPATLVDSNLWSAIAGYFDSLQALRPLQENRAIALATRPTDTTLVARINQYLTSRALSGRRERFYTDDLAGLRKRKVLRMLTRNSAASYYLYRGAPYGFDYELMSRFADRMGMRLQVVIPPDNDSLISWLQEGRGDVIAAMWTDTVARRQKVDFSRPYFYADEVLVERSDEHITSPDQLAGRTIHVRRSSSYYDSLLRLDAGTGDFSIEAAPEDMPTEQVLGKVADGDWDLTVADSHLLAIEQTHGQALQAGFTLASRQPIAWAVRKNNPDLEQALNAYVRSTYRGTAYNVIKKRYFEDRKDLDQNVVQWRVDRSGRLSPYDDIIKRVALRNDFDWRLIAAQVYQESQFEPGRQSWAGAYGLMQVLPRVAREVGVADFKTPVGSITAGVRYLRRMVDLLDPKLPLQTRLRFGLASYNAGRGHLLDARRLARKLGWSPNRWYGNVEKAMLLLSEPRYHRDSRFGYVRGIEPVQYVREIEQRYNEYISQLPKPHLPQAAVGSH